MALAVLLTARVGGGMGILSTGAAAGQVVAGQPIAGGSITNRAAVAPAAGATRFAAFCRRRHPTGGPRSPGPPAAATAAPGG